MVEEKLRLLVKMLLLVMLLSTAGEQVVAGLNVNAVGGVNLRAERAKSARERRAADMLERRGWIYMADMR